MTRIDIVSGFLGAGKTTWIKKWISTENYQKYYPKTLILENEFGEVALDGPILSPSNVTIKELTSGCICCSISGDFKEAILSCIEEMQPDRIIIEPSGVAKLSEVIEACKFLARSQTIVFGQAITIVDATQFQLFLENFGEFYEDQIVKAHHLLLSKTETLSDEELKEIIKAVKTLNPVAHLIHQNWNGLDNDQTFGLMELDFSLFELGDVFQIIKPDHAHHHANEVFNNFGLMGLSPIGLHDLKEGFALLKNSPQGRGIIRGKGLFNLLDGTCIKMDWVGTDLCFATWEGSSDSRFCLIGSQMNLDDLNAYFKNWPLI